LVNLARLLVAAGALALAVAGVYPDGEQPAELAGRAVADDEPLGLGGRDPGGRAARADGTLNEGPPGVRPRAGERLAERRVHYRGRVDGSVIRVTTLWQYPVLTAKGTPASDEGDAVYQRHVMLLEDSEHETRYTVGKLLDAAGGTGAFLLEVETAGKKVLRLQITCRLALHADSVLELAKALQTGDYWVRRIPEAEWAVEVNGKAWHYRWDDIRKVPERCRVRPFVLSPDYCSESTVNGAAFAHSPFCWVTARTRVPDPPVLTLSWLPRPCLNGVAFVHPVVE
jgi:hypothetical protein